MLPQTHLVPLFDLLSAGFGANDEARHRCSRFSIYPPIVECVWMMDPSRLIFAAFVPAPPTPSSSPSTISRLSMGELLPRQRFLPHVLLNLDASLRGQSSVGY